MRCRGKSRGRWNNTQLHTGSPGWPGLHSPGPWDQLPTSGRFPHPRCPGARRPNGARQRGFGSSTRARRIKNISSKCRLNGSVSTALQLRSPPWPSQRGTQQTRGTGGRCQLRLHRCPQHTGTALARGDPGEWAHRLLTAERSESCPQAPAAELPHLHGCCVENEAISERANSHENGWRETGSSVIHPSNQLN